MERRTRRTRTAARSEPGAATLRRRLLAFYDRERRDLPWRRTSDPWAILVSEVMLQQTTVSAAIPYYERLLARWPLPADLARASRDELLSEWAGLGYYRRAHLLHEAACRVAEDGGRLPDTRDGLAALPGVGDYTAAAVASIAFGECVPAVDGNVERVLSRLLALPDDPARAAGRRPVVALAQELIGTRRPGDANQALMELGATVCRPTSPDCGRCPLAAGCEGLASGTPEAYPRRAPRRPTVAVLKTAALVRRGARVLLSRRAEAPNQGFWELPQCELVRGSGAESSTPDSQDAGRRLVAWLRREHRLLARVVRAGPPHRHAITHHRIRVLPFETKLDGGRARAPLAWIDPGPHEPLTTASRRMLAAARQAPASSASSDDRARAGSAR
ncbi:MAG: A/G-specific adenine glycosylase [Planctomycetota bacterium]|jgi:A/G-specific adenine glycosylase